MVADNRAGGKVRGASKLLGASARHGAVLASGAAMRSNATSTWVLVGLGLGLAHAGGCIFLVDDATSGGGGAGAGAGGALAATGTGGGGTGGSPPAGGGGFGGSGAGGAGGAGGEAVCPIDVYPLGVPIVADGAIVDLAASSQHIALAFETTGPVQVYAGPIPSIPRESDVAWMPAQLGGTPGVTARLAFGSTTSPAADRLFVLTPTRFFASTVMPVGGFVQATGYTPRSSDPEPARLIALGPDLLAVSYASGGLDTVTVTGETPLVAVRSERGDAAYSDLARLDAGGTDFLAAPAEPGSKIHRCYANSGCLPAGQSELDAPATSLQVRANPDGVGVQGRLIAYVNDEGDLVLASCDTSIASLACHNPSFTLPADAKGSAVALARDALLASLRVGTQQALHACCGATADSVSTCNTLINSAVPTEPLVQIVPIGDSEFVARDSAHKLHRIRVGN